MESIDKITRGHQAERLLDDPLMKECFAILESNAVSRLKASDVNDTKTLQTLVMGLQAASGFRRNLEMIARDGATAIEQEEEKQPELSTIRRIARHFV
jgi:hypothetical protein